MLNAGSEPGMQDSMDMFSTICNSFGLKINTKKTEFMHQPAPGHLYAKPSITVKGQKLPAIDKCKYLTSILSKTVNINEEVNCRIAKVSANSGRLCDTVWEWSLEMKLKVYSSFVVSTSLYACEM